MKRNATALRIIQQGISKSIYLRIFSIKKAREACEILRNEFQGYQKAIFIWLRNLWREFEILIMKDNEVVKDFSFRTIEIINQIKSCEDNVSDKRIAENF